MILRVRISAFLFPQDTSASSVSASALRSNPRILINQSLLPGSKRAFPDPGAAVAWKNFLLLLEDPLVSVRDLKLIVPEHCARLYPKEPKVTVVDVKDAHGYDLDEDYLVAQILAPGEESLQVVLSAEEGKAVLNSPTKQTVPRKRANVAKSASTQPPQIKAPLPSKAPASIITPPETPPAPSQPVLTKPALVKMVDQQVLEQFTSTIASADKLPQITAPISSSSAETSSAEEESEEESIESSSTRIQQKEESSSEAEPSEEDSSSEEESEKENEMPISPSPMPAPVIQMPAEVPVQPKVEEESESESDTTSSSASSPQKPTTKTAAAAAATGGRKYGTNLFKKLPAGNKK